MAELVRVLHQLPIRDAQETVDRLSEIRVPLVWEKGEIRRVLNPKLRQKPQILVLLASSGAATVDELAAWIEAKDRAYFLKILRAMHKERIIEFDEDVGSVEMLPPGFKVAADVIKEFSKT